MERRTLTFKPSAEVNVALFGGRGVREGVFVQPDWRQVHRELARVGLTLKLLHQEYVDRVCIVFG